MREAAARLAVSTATVYSLVHRGEILHVRISNAVRIRPQDFEAFVAGVWEIALGSPHGK